MEATKRLYAPNVIRYVSFLGDGYMKIANFFDTPTYSYETTRFYEVATDIDSVC